MGVNNLPRVATQQCAGRELNLQPLDYKSNTLLLHYRAQKYITRRILLYDYFYFHPLNNNNIWTIFVVTVLRALRKFTAETATDGCRMPTFGLDQADRLEPYKPSYMQLGNYIHAIPFIIITQPKS